jgi:hypothetical protein
MLQIYTNADETWVFSVQVGAGEVSRVVLVAPLACAAVDSRLFVCGCPPSDRVDWW